MTLRRLMFIVLLTPICVASGAAPTAGQAGDDEVIATERRALERWVKGDPDGFLEIYADEVTYFSPTTARLVDGRAAMVALLAPIRGKIRIDRFELLNPKVQRYGDIAVLTYNVVNYMKQPDGTERSTTRWNSTAVFRRSGGRWRTIHSHFSYITPDVRQ